MLRTPWLRCGLAALLATQAPTGITAEATPATLAGSWEGEVLGGRRPYRANLDLMREGDDWTATLSLDGRFELAVAALSVEPDALRFETNLNGEDYVMQLRREGDRLRGPVSGGATPLSMHLDRLPVLRPPADRAEAWAQDIDVVTSRFLRLDRSFSEAVLPEVRAALDRLRGEAAALSDEAIVVRLSAIVARSGNAHTRLYLLRNRTALRRMPVRVHGFEDGLYVVQTTVEHARLLGCRVVDIAGVDTATAQARVARLFAGNASWQRYKGPYFLTSPEILGGLGIAGDMERIPYRVRCGEEPREATLAPLPLERKERPTEAWRDLSPHAVESGWRHVLDASETPLYLKRPARHYWMVELPEHDLVYFQYNRSQDMPQGEGITAFGERLLARLRQRPPTRLAIDLRFNTGGNNGLARSLFDELAAFATSRPESRVYVLTGRATFSAGISHVAQLATTPGVTLVGEPVGDVLDTWSEGGNLVLPNSGLTVHYTNGFHRYSRRDYPQRKPYFQSMDLPDHALEPHVLVGLRFAEYRAGIDPLLQAISGPPAQR